MKPFNQSVKSFNQIRYWLKFVAIALLSFAVACQSYLPGNARSIATPRDGTPSHQPAASIATQPNKALNADQLIDIHLINASIRLDMRYATPNNFLHRSLYKQPRCLLRSPVAEQLSAVQTDLEAIGLGLKVYDCYRPLSVQKAMWKLVPDSRYVANPMIGSRHNRGSAVDVTLVDRSGVELSMPTKFDDFTERAAVNYRGTDAQAAKHRQQLEDVMRKHGFTPLQTEWWHFDAVNWQQFPLLDVAIESVP